MIRAIVTDIEGTTSDIRFVHNVLFPYARERLAGFVTAQQHAEPVKTILDNPATLPAISTRTYCRRWRNGKRRVLICMYIPQVPWLRRNCYLATAMKVILLICSRAISIPW